MSLPLSFVAAAAVLRAVVLAQGAPPAPPPATAAPPPSAPAPTPVPAAETAAVQDAAVVAPAAALPAAESAAAAHLQSARQVVPLRALSKDGARVTNASASGAVLPPEGMAAGADEAIAAHAVAGAERSAAAAAANEANAAGVAGVASPAGAGAEKSSGREFIKGDLIYPGTRRLLSRFNHVGVNVGPDIIGNDYYLTVDPGFTWYMKNGVSMSLHVPLRLEAMQAGRWKPGSFLVRKADWLEASDYAKVIRFLTFGRKEANVYASINTMRPVTIGHGMLVNRYQGDMDVDRSFTGAVLDAYGRYGGVELQANDIMLKNRVFGGLAFVKPLSLLGSGPYYEGVSLGVEAASDQRAPRCVLVAKGASDCVQGLGQGAGFDPYTGATLDHTFVRSDPGTGRFDVATAAVTAMGLSLEGKVYRDERNADIKLYGNAHRFTNQGGGSGYSSGVLARLNAGDEWLSAFRLRAEYRGFGDGFVPSYFDSLYEIQKYGYHPYTTTYQVAPTKYQAIFGDPANGFARAKLGWRNGYNVEAAWALFYKQRSAKKLGVGFGLSDSSGANDTSFYAHLESPALGFLQFFATYMGMNLPSFHDALSRTGWRSQDTVLLTGARLEILPVLFVNAHYSRSFRTVASPGSEYHLGNANVLDAATGMPSPYFKTMNLFEKVQTLFVQVEWGWEFSDE